MSVGVSIIGSRRDLPSALELALESQRLTCGASAFSFVCGAQFDCYLPFQPPSPLNVHERRLRFAPDASIVDTIHVPPISSFLSTSHFLFINSIHSLSLTA